MEKMVYQNIWRMAGYLKRRFSRKNLYMEICSATKNCDMEKDKGCKITKPDRIGEEKIYLLEKEL